VKVALTVFAQLRRMLCIGKVLRHSPSYAQHTAQLYPPAPLPPENHHHPGPLIQPIATTDTPVTLPLPPPSSILLLPPPPCSFHALPPPLMLVLCSTPPTPHYARSMLYTPLCSFYALPPPQGAALSELQAFFPALASSNAPTAQPDTLLKMLLDAGRGR